MKEKDSFLVFNMVDPLFDGYENSKFLLNIIFWKHSVGASASWSDVPKGIHQSSYQNCLPRFFPL